MPNVKVIDIEGKEVSTISLSDDIFGIKPNKAVMHACVVNYLANQRQGNQSTLTRAEVSGGGKKPWKQKGTGHARQGSTRSPQWRHGGVALGPKPRSYRYTLNKKVKRLGLQSAFSAKLLDDQMIILDSLSLEAIKTREMAKILNAIGVEKKALIVIPENNENIVKSARNIKGVKTALVNTLNVYDVVNADKFIIIRDAVAQIEEVYA